MNIVSVQERLNTAWSVIDTSYIIESLLLGCFNYYTSDREDIKDSDETAQMQSIVCKIRFSHGAQIIIEYYIL